MSAALAHGDVVAKRYRLLAPLGQGGMGVVWRAEHLVLGRPVAVKFVTPGRSNNLRRAQRFLSEAKAVATVRHPNVVDILDFGVSDLGQPYMVMELLEGTSLRERLATKPPLSIGLLLDYVDSVLAGLCAVHEAGLVHRDLKPENVFLSEEAGGVVPKLLDFGLTHVVQDSPSSHDAVTLTQEDQILGTPAFMAPEQVRQLEDLDARADIWGVGVLLYSALAGKLPFDEPKIVDLLFEITRGEAPASVAALRPAVGAALSTVVARAMARDRSERYASAQELRVALGEARAASSAALAEPARPLPASLREPEAAWNLGGGGSVQGDAHTPEVLSLGSDPRDESSIRERAKAPRGSRRRAIAVAAILVVGASLWTWVWSELFSDAGPRSGTTRPAAGTDVGAPAPSGSGDPAVGQRGEPNAEGRARRRGLGSARPRKAGVAKDRTEPREGAPTLFREPDY